MVLINYFCGCFLIKVDHMVCWFVLSLSSVNNTASVKWNIQYFTVNFVFIMLLYVSRQSFNIKLFIYFDHLFVNDFTLLSKDFTLSFFKTKVEFTSTIYLHLTRYRYPDYVLGFERRNINIFFLLYLIVFFWQNKLYINGVLSNRHNCLVLNRLPDIVLKHLLLEPDFEKGYL